VTYGRMPRESKRIFRRGAGGSQRGMPNAVAPSSILVKVIELLVIPLSAIASRVLVGTVGCRMLVVCSLDHARIAVEDAFEYRCSVISRVLMIPSEPTYDSRAGPPSDVAHPTCTSRDRSDARLLALTFDGIADTLLPDRERLLDDRLVAEDVSDEFGVGSLAPSPSRPDALGELNGRGP